MVDFCDIHVPSGFPVSNVQTGVSKRSEDVWFDDGTLILQAESTQFKVYRGILSENSSVFRDMFTIAQPGDSEVVEGCPIIHLYDKARDVMHFLKAIHFAGYYDTSGTVSFSLIAGVLRLSTKYNVEYLRRRAFLQLSSLYPTTLAEWEQRTDKTIEVFDARPFEVIQLAKETGHLSLLPACMYLCSDSADINTILDGLTSIDGSHIELEWKDKRVCLRARQNIFLALRTRIYGFLLGLADFPGCTTPATCNGARYEWVKTLETSLGNGASGAFSRPFPWNSFRQAVCETCYNISWLNSNAERQAVWEELPSFFDLPDWDSLRIAAHP